MTGEEYIKQQIAAGHKIHQNNGVWWQKRAPFFYKPVNFLQKIKPGDAKPSLSKSFLGFSHLVNDANYANNTWPVMILNSEKLKEFSIDKLHKSKKKRIRRGLKLTHIERIEDIKAAMKDIQDICISMAKRTNHGLPPEYYIENYDKWRSYMISEFSLPKREWWGAYCDNKLVAYRYDVLIDNTMFFMATKSHTDYLSQCPNDALMYIFINYCKELKDCKDLNAGDWNRKASLNRFKELFGFEKVDVIMYKQYNPLLFIVKKSINMFKGLKSSSLY